MGLDFYWPTWSNGTTGALLGCKGWGSTGVVGERIPTTFTPASVIGTGDYSVINRGAAGYFMCYSNTRIFLSNTQNFGVAHSTDLQTWTEIATVDLSGAPTPNYHIGAPEWFTDNDGKVYVVVQGIDATGTDFQFLILQPNDPDVMTSWGTTTTLTWTGTPRDKVIDPFIIRPGDDPYYYLWYKYEPNVCIEYARALSITGPYDPQGIFDWAGWSLPCEGPSLRDLGTHWRLFADNFPELGMVFSDSASRSFAGPWTAFKPFGLALGGTDRPRHCSGLKLN